MTTKVIKRWNNGKLYDTENSTYVVCGDIAKMVIDKKEIMVVDNKTKKDITAETMTQVIYEWHRRSREFDSISTLRDKITQLY